MGWLRKENLRNLRKLLWIVVRSRRRVPPRGAVLRIQSECEISALKAFRRPRLLVNSLLLPLGPNARP